MARQNLLPATILNQIPRLYSQESKGENATVFVKYFCNRNGWSWYATEYDPTDRLFFGLVKGFETELGYFSLAEFEELGNLIERDKWFQPCTIAECRKTDV